MHKSKKTCVETNEITRKEALRRIGSYGKYATLTALGTYIMLHPKAAQANSLQGSPPPPPDGFQF